MQDEDPLPLALPKRTEIKVLTVESVDATELPTLPSEETFADPLKRLKLDKDEKEELAQHLEDVLADIETQRQTLDCDSNWDLWEDNYFGVLGALSSGQQNRVHLPLTQEIIDTIGAVIERAVFTAQPVFQISPREKMDVQTSKRKEQHLDYAFTVEMRGKERLDPVLFDTRLLGTGVVHLPWLLETDRIRDEQTYDGLNTKDMERFLERYPNAHDDMPEIVAKLRKHQKVRFGVEYTEALYDAPDLTHIPLRSWVVRPNAKAHLLHREPLVGHYFKLRWDDLVRLSEEDYYDDVDPVKMGADANGQPTVSADYETEDHEIFTGVVRWRRGDETRERRYLVDYHRTSRTILRILRYPYWHNRINYIPCYLQKSSRSIYGLSVAQKIESSQWEANASHSLLLDLLSYSVPMFAARQGTQTMFNPMRDGIYAGKTWYLPNPQQDVQQFQVSTPASASLLLTVESQATRHAELSSGATQNLSGLESARDPQAPATKTIHQTTQALVRLGQYLGTLASSLTELAYQIEELYYQFSPEGRVFRVIGADGHPAFPTISRQELQLRADYLPHISTASLNPDKEKDDTFAAVELLMKEPGIAESDVKRWALWETALDTMGSDWSKKKHAVLPSPEEMALFQEEQALLLKAKGVKLKQQAQQLQQAESQGGANVQPQGGGSGAGGAPAPGAPAGIGGANGHSPAPGAIPAAAGAPGPSLPFALR